eukprot:gnl/TRDRNA2_/TRDRNA2_78757_c2_seq1.p1 gnl/TRDRNA2_/TRDRNA2_78757_c2~~gnl/TRDRNA2_/TRDRNA2_78757_c2_seq1.p1  ORF type:complete len:189 (+),score=31.99 gnl/TRDRNA2_/TRDRNA2_78757_c2_seq1:49-567(+)
MSIFPVKRTQREAKFKVQINNICSQLPTDLAADGRLPSLGFTEITPALMDEMGGLPTKLEYTAKSLCIRGDGRVVRTSGKEHYKPGQDAPGLFQEAVGPTSTLFPYSVAAGDSLDCVWGPGYISVLVNDEELFRVEDSDGLGVDIGRPPTSKTPLFGIIDCCHAACKVTLMA